MAASWSFAMPDWEVRIMAGQSLMPDLPLFHAEANIALEIFDNLRLSDVEGTPLLGDAVGDWFREIVAAVLGSRDPETNVRHVAELMLMVSKGNSKTTNSAELMLTALIMNQRPRAKFFLIAPSQSTADVAFDAIKGSIELDPELNNRYWPRNVKNQQTIVDRVTKAELQIKTFSLEILNGPKPVGVLLDEIHLLSKLPNAAKIMRQIRGGLQKNAEAFFIMTTTQSNEEPAGVFLEELTAARDIRDGKREGRLLPILYEFPKDIARDEERWSDPKVWPVVMPNLGRSLRLDSLLKDWNDEKDKSEEAKRLWASQHLNIQIGLGMRGNSWVGAEFWAKRVDVNFLGLDHMAALDNLLARCEVAVVGIDGGGQDDLLGLCVLGREKLTRRWIGWHHAWCKEIALERRKQIAPRLRDFQKTGHLTILPDESDDDIKQAVDILELVRDAGLLPEESAIGLDRIGIPDILDVLVERAFTFGTEEEMGQVRPVTQGYKLNSAIGTTGRRLAQGRLVHDGSPMMAWCVGNAKVEPKGNAVMITKQEAGVAKIDPLMALFNAAELMSMNPDAGASIYEERGLRIA